MRQRRRSRLAGRGSFRCWRWRRSWCSSPGVARRSRSPTRTITPQTEKANDIQTLYKIIFWAALIVFIGVQAAIVYTALRFRRRNEERPEQVHGSRKLEIAWTVIPAVILLVLFIPTAQVIFKHADAADGPKMSSTSMSSASSGGGSSATRDIPADPNDPDAGPLVTANEVTPPRRRRRRLQSAQQQCHPLLLGAAAQRQSWTSIPGHDNPIAVRRQHTGRLLRRVRRVLRRRPRLDALQGENRAAGEVRRLGHGLAHAARRPTPIPRPPTWWRRRPLSAPASPATASAAPTPAGRSQGMGANSGYLDPESNEVIRAGPNLTLLAAATRSPPASSRTRRENLERWLKHTDEVKEGVYMPNYYTMDPGLTDEQVDELVTYLESLKPAAVAPATDSWSAANSPPAAIEATDPTRSQDRTRRNRGIAGDCGATRTRITHEDIRRPGVRQWHRSRSHRFKRPRFPGRRGGERAVELADHRRSQAHRHALRRDRVLFFLLGGLEALLIRAQLTRPKTTSSTPSATTSSSRCTARR